MRRSLMLTLVVIAAIVLTVGVVRAASLNVTSTLGGASGDSFDLDGTLIVDSLKVGAQSVGGVTFFNGTIVNNTTDSTGADNPVTFGDNVRIDGRVYRGATAGTSDSMPFIVNDNMEVTGDLIVNGTVSATKLQELVSGGVSAAGFKTTALSATTWVGNVHYLTSSGANKAYTVSDEITVVFTPTSNTTGTWTSTLFQPFNMANTVCESSGNYTVIENALFFTYTCSYALGSEDYPGTYTGGQNTIIDLNGNTMTWYNATSSPGTITVLTKQ